MEPVFDTSISNVNVVVKPVGLPDSGVIIKSIFNTNGFTISQIQSTVGTEFTCTLVTPVLGFSTAPFKVGDEVFVEEYKKIILKEQDIILRTMVLIYS